MRLPDYQGGSIVNLMASLQEGLGGHRHPYASLKLLPPDRVSRHRQVLLLVVDGLGLRYLQDHPEAGWLNEHLLGGITSVFPSTTASAIPTYLTGEAPQQHGLTGWFMYFRELASVLAVLPGRPRCGGQGLGEAGLDARRLLDPRPLNTRIDIESHLVSPAFIAGSDFSRAYLGNAQLTAFRDFADLLHQCERLLQRPGARYLYAYWPELDSLGHQLGMGSEPTRAHLLELDRAIGEFVDSIRGTDTLVIVCADHGQIDPPPAHRIDLGDHPAMQDCLVLPLCGEPRAAYCYLKPGSESVFDDYVRSELDWAMESRPSAQAMEAGWFGLGQPHPQLRDRIGDRILVMKEDYVLKDWLPQEKRYDMIGVHGGTSADELLVPLIVAEA